MASGKTSLSKEAKAALKSAKEAIKSKEYKEAIKFCKVQYVMHCRDKLHLLFNTKTWQIVHYSAQELKTYNHHLKVYF